MEFIFELLLELILEGCIEGSQNAKLPLIFRITLGLLVCLFLFGVSSLLVILGISITKKNAWVGSFILAIGLFFLIASVCKIRGLYVKKVSNKE